jgi:DNA primase
MDWPSAVRYVAEKSGVEIQEVDTRRNREAPDEREPLWEVNAAASEYFRRILWEDELGAPARAYLAQRGIEREVADRFGLGYAPREIGLLRAYLQTLGFDDERQIEAGVLVVREETTEPRPRFRARLMFPIYDVQGRVIGFGGRLIAPGEPKYLNSAESKVFSKGRTLYGLNWARHAIRKDERALVVEGYFDVVRLVAAGVESVVAPLGTALTEAQAQLVRKYTANVFLLYDSDEAGLKATFRSGLELLAQGAAVRVVTLPDGEDPDTFVAKQGAAALERQLAEAIDVFDRQVQILERRGWFAELHKTRRAIDKLLPTIRATSDPITRDIYTSRLAAAAGVEKALVATEAAAAPARPGGTRPGAPARGARADGPPSDGDYGRPEAPTGEPPAYDGPMADDGPGEWQAPPRRKWEPRGGDGRRGNRRYPEEPPADTRVPRVRMGAEVAVERNLVRLLLMHPHLAAQVAERVDPASIGEPHLLEIYLALLAHGEDGFDAIQATLSPAAAELHVLLVQEDPPIISREAGTSQVEGFLHGILAQREVFALDRRLAEIDRAVAAASDSEKNALLVEKGELFNKRRALGGRGFKTFTTKRKGR